MRVLVLSPEAPCFPGSGGQTRQHSLLEPLAAAHHVRVVSPGRPAPFSSPPRGVEVIAVRAEPPGEPETGSWLVRNLRHVAGGEPYLYHFERHDVDALAAMLATQLAEFQPDIVQVEHSHLSPLLGHLPAGLPSVLVMHNLTFPMASSLLGARRPRGPHGWLMETLMTARAERRAMGRATRVVVVSRRDARLAQRLQPAAQVTVVPNCVPVGYFADSPRAPAAVPTFVFTASFFWPPNQDAARLLLRDVLPAVRRTHREAQLVLAGRGMPDDLRHEAAFAAGCSVTGEVPDIRPVLGAAWVSVAPLPAAGGTQLKVLESLASGVPVVTTAAVAQRLELGRADGVLASGGTSGVVAGICAALESLEECQALGRAGQESIRVRFDRALVAPLQERVWQEAMATT